MSLSVTPAATAAPARVVSLNLCTDELVLLLATPPQVASVTYLSRDPRESTLWRQARRHPANDGTLLSAAGARPDLVVAMGGGGRDRERIAHALGARLVDLPAPASLDDVDRSIATLSRALGREQAGARLRAALARARVVAPRGKSDAIFLSGGGRSLSAGGLAAEWLGLAGLRQRALPGDRLDAETLLLSPPAVLVTSDYRAGETSRESLWLRQPVLARARIARRVATEGRRWTCMGPTLLPEIARLRAELGR